MVIGTMPYNGLAWPCGILLSFRVQTRTGVDSMKQELKRFGLAAGLLASQVLLGCLSQESQKTATGPANPGMDQETGNAAKVRDYILSLGYDPKDIVSEGDRFMVEGDMAYDKNKSYGTPSTTGVLAKSGQYY